MAKSDIRTVSAQVLAEILTKEDFQDVSVMVISSAGASDSRIVVGLGIGSMYVRDSE